MFTGKMLLYGPVVLILTFSLLVSEIDGRVFLVGSNPSLSLLAFPQDLLKFDKDNVFYSLSYERKPWWSDVDDPPNKPVNESANRPNNTYLATGESVVDQNSNFFEHKSHINAIQNQIGFTRSLKHAIKARFDLRYSAWPMITEASGNVDNISFQYEEHNSFHEIYLNSILAKKIGDIPVGIKIGLGGIATSKPNVESNISGDSNRLYWGWSASQGGDILGTGNHLDMLRSKTATFWGPCWNLIYRQGPRFPGWIWVLVSGIILETWIPITTRIL